MIYGLGIDLVQIKRIEKALDRFGDRFARRIMGEEERELFRERRDKATFLAGRIAAKEAVMKTISTYFDTGGLYFKMIQILNDYYGRPYIHLEDKIREKIFDKEIKISITHDRESAAAVAIMSGD
jgi:holo-[acyl-carrier protein] synthase